MASPSEPTSPRTPEHNRLLALLLLVPIAIVLSTAWSFGHSHERHSLFLLSNLVGPTTESLLHGQGLATCTDIMGTPHHPICFHAARMPLPSLVVALGIKIFGNRYLRVLFFKTLLLLLPVEAAIYLVWLRLPISPRRRLTMTLLLLAPFAISAFLANTVNMQVEEGYSYSFLALAAAILFFGMDRAISRRTNRTLVLAVLFAISLDGLYLSKSSMLLATAVLLASYLWMERRTALRLLVLALVAAAPIGWALHQHHASGRFSLGTSLDGINLHKGNNPAFLDHYPPPPGDTLDRFDPTLNLGQTFANEWDFNDYHQRAAMSYLWTHPLKTSHADLRKLDVLLFSINKVGSSRDHASTRLIEVCGLLLFRLVLWSAIASAIYALFRPSIPNHPGVSDTPTLNHIGAIFLALVLACTLPYILGFAYTRHVSILIYPAALMCCRMLMHAPRDEAHRANLVQPATPA